jgi:DNA-binding response OmpR family regulator
MVSELYRKGTRVPFAIVTGRGSIPMAVDAMRLGALDVIEKPFSSSEFLNKTKELLALIGSRSLGDNTAGGLSAADRWAELVLAGTESDRDPRTLVLWGHQVGVSYSSLREACELVHIRPHDARDFMRILRAVLRVQTEHRSLEAYVDVHDARTMKALMQRAGVVQWSRHSAPSVGDYLSNQTFVPVTNEGMIAVIARLERRRCLSR